MELVQNLINLVNVNKDGIQIYVYNLNILAIKKDVKEEVFVMLMEHVVVIMELLQKIV